MSTRPVPVLICDSSALCHADPITNEDRHFNAAAYPSRVNFPFSKSTDSAIRPPVLIATCVRVRVGMLMRRRDYEYKARKKTPSPGKFRKHVFCVFTLSYCFLLLVLLVLVLLVLVLPLLLNFIT